MTDRPKSFSVKLENLHEIVSSAMSEKPDIVSFREIQGEAAKLLRNLSMAHSLVSERNFSVSFGGADDDSSLLEKTEFARLLSKQLFAKHLSNALDEMKQICFEVILEEISPIPPGSTNSRSAPPANQKKQNPDDDLFIDSDENTD
jgi:hypothetical protein